jgi:hypothetical protein
MILSFDQEFTFPSPSPSFNPGDSSSSFTYCGMIDCRVRQVAVSLFFLFVTIRTPQSGPDDPVRYSITVPLVYICVCTSRVETNRPV